jgi:hypothetical protein
MCYGLIVMFKYRLLMAFLFMSQGPVLPIKPHGRWHRSTKTTLLGNPNYWMVRGTFCIQNIYKQIPI